MTGRGLCLVRVPPGGLGNRSPAGAENRRRGVPRAGRVEDSRSGTWSPGPASPGPLSPATSSALAPTAWPSARTSRMGPGAGGATGSTPTWSPRTTGSRTPPSGNPPSTRPSAGITGRGWPRSGMTAGSSGCASMDRTTTSTRLPANRMIGKTGGLAAVGSSSDECSWGTLAGAGHHTSRSGYSSGELDHV